MHQCQKRPYTQVKETYYIFKKDLRHFPLRHCRGKITLKGFDAVLNLKPVLLHFLLIPPLCKRPVSKEAYKSVKRGLLECQKRPTSISLRSSLYVALSSTSWRSMTSFLDASPSFVLVKSASVAALTFSSCAYFAEAARSAWFISSLSVSHTNTHTHTHTHTHSPGSSRH